MCMIAPVEFCTRRGHMAKRGKAGRARVSKKISKLSHEGYEQKQAVAIALNMAREGELGKAAKSAAPAKKHNPKALKYKGTKHYRE